MGGDQPTEVEVVAVAADAAEDLIFSRVDRSAIEDIDVTVSFEDGVLDVDVYLHAPTADAEQIVDDAALAAQAAVDTLFEEQSGTED